MNIGRMAWEDGLPNEIQVSTDWEYILDRVYDGPSIRSAPIENKDIRLIDHVLSGEEADRIIQEAETFGFGKTNYPKHYRGNLRLICEDEGLSKQMFERLQSCIPTTVIEDGIEWEALGLNEVWRLSKYLPGDRFGKHVDATFERKTVTPREKGMYTVNIYLNGGFDGGCTRFIDREGQVEVSIAPCQGLCLIFRQPPTAAYAHDGEELLSGVKYLLRSDVMYRSLEGRGQHLSLSP